MIVIEGCDGSGKSTLVTHLSKKYGFEVGKRGVADRDKLYTVTRQDTYSALAEAVRGTTPQIWDRLFVSEFVYADIVGRPCEFSLKEQNFVVDVMNVLEFPMIACLPPYEIVLANSIKVHQMEGVSQNLRTIYDRYAHGNLPWPENTLWYDYTGSGQFCSLEDIEEEIEGYLLERKVREAWH